jgi:hypothetical protein
MEVKKDIGKAFREKLDSLDRQPGDALWNAISTDLDKQKKKKSPFLWLYIFSSSLVAIMLMVYVLSNVSRSDNDAGSAKPDGVPNNSITTGSLPSANGENSSGSQNAINDSSANTPEQPQNTADGITLTDTERNNAELENSSSTKNSNAKKGGAKNNTTVGTDNGTGSTLKSSNLKNNTVSATKQQQHKQHTTRTNSSNNSKTAKSGNTKKSYPASSYTAAGKDISASAKDNTDANNNGGTKTAANTGNTTIADNSNDKLSTNKNGTIAEKQNSNTPESSNAASSAATSAKEIGTKEIGTAFPHDSIPETIVAKDSLKPELPKEIAKEKKEENKEDSIVPKPFKKFSIYAYGGPSYFSFPDRTIATDSTTANVSTSNTIRYGVLFGYRINNKLSIRTGLSLFNLKQSAKNLKLSYYMETTPIGGAQIVPPPDFTWIDYQQPFGTNSSQIINTLGENYNAIINIDRELSYVEIPLEVSYDLFDKKFGLNVFGGGSMLILNKNKVFAYNEKGKMYLGEWNAAAKTSFTGTLGLGLNYNFSPSLQLNAEPVFNYYFNSFKDSKPYSFTFRIGLQYNFDF